MCVYMIKKKIIGRFLDCFYDNVTNEFNDVFRNFEDVVYYETAEPELGVSV